MITEQELKSIALRSMTNLPDDQDILSASLHLRVAAERLAILLEYPDMRPLQTMYEVTMSTGKK